MGVNGTNVFPYIEFVRANRAGLKRVMSVAMTVILDQRPCLEIGVDRASC